jgi:hypothetical protein
MPDIFGSQFMCLRKDSGAKFHLGQALLAIMSAESEEIICAMVGPTTAAQGLMSTSGGEGHGISLNQWIAA